MLKKLPRVKWMVLIFIVSLLAACGGGGSGSPNSSSGLPDLVVTAFSAPSSGTAGGTFTVTGTIANQGGGMAVGVSALIYLSHFSDVSTDGGQVGLDIYAAFLDPGESWNFSIMVNLPANVANGNYYLGAVALYGDETDKSNNMSSRPITITGGTTCSSDSYEIDDSLGTAKTLNFGVTQQHNHCEATSDWMSFSAIGGSTYGISAAKVGNKASAAVSLYSTDGSTLLASGSSSFSSGVSRVTWTAPASGTYYVKVSPSMGTLSAGANTDYIITLGNQGPDLIVQSFSASSTGLPGGIIWVSDSVRNQGFTAAGSFDVSVYLSTDATVTNSDILIGTRTISTLAVDQTNYSSTLNYSLPAGLTAGTYYLAAIVNPTGALSEVTTANNAGPVSAITVQSLGSCTADTYEEDDNTGTAKTITVGSAAQSHNHCEDYADWLSFSAEAGKSYMIRVTRSGLSEAWAEVYAADGTTLLAGNGSNETTLVDLQASAGGTYYIKVGSYAGGIGAGRDYAVQVQPKLPDLVETLSLQNGTTVVAGGLLNATDTVSNAGYLAAGQFEIGFYISQDATVTTVDALGATRSVTGLPDQSSWGSTDTSWSNYVHFTKDTLPGTYYLATIADHTNLIQEVYDDNNTSAPLVVTVVAPSCAWDVYEDDDTPATAQPITSGETQSRNFCDDGIDWVSVTPSVSGYYVANATASLGSLELFQSDGVTRVTPHDTYFYNRLSWAAAADTTYLLKYSTSNSAASGAYQLSLYQCSDVFEDDDTMATAKTISVGETQARNHCEDRYDWAKFDAIAGTTYTITATNGQNVNTVLVDGSSTALATGQSAQGGKLKVINWTAPATGTYYIEVDTFEFGQNTDYTLNMK